MKGDIDALRALGVEFVCMQDAGLFRWWEVMQTISVLITSLDHYESLESRATG